MKALLVEGSGNPARSNLEQTAIVLLPVGVLDPHIEPFECIFLGENNECCFRSLSYEEVTALKIHKGVEISQDTVTKITETINVKSELKKKQSELREALLKEQVDPNCDAMSYLDYGSIFF